MSNSSLISMRKISPNRNSPRNHAIDTITIHCYVGQASIESMAAWLCNPQAKASANYGIGSDGRIICMVDETDRSWCSSNAANDNRAITIECASDVSDPFRVSLNSCSIISESGCLRSTIESCERRKFRQRCLTAEKRYASGCCSSGSISLRSHK